MDKCLEDCNTCEFAGGCKDYGKNIPFKLDNFKVNKEHIWIGDAVFSFYHHQNCDTCGYCVPGWNDQNEDGPWMFKCPKCESKWGIAMTDERKEKRDKLLKLFKTIDGLVTEAKQIGKGYVTI